MARQFGSTWWGLAWVEAIESRDGDNAGRLSRGRTYARQGKVVATEVLPGQVVGRVEGGEEYSADVSVKALTDQQWDQFVGFVIERAAHAAALLTGELPVALRDEMLEVGIELLPSGQDLIPDCSCPDWGDPCKHAAALCYVITDLIDDDPFTVLLLRGRSRDQLLDQIRDGRSKRLVAEMPTDMSPPDRNEVGIDAYKIMRRERAPLPKTYVPQRPGRPVSIPHQPPVDSGVDVESLRALVADAAKRSVAFFAFEAGTCLDMDVRADAARRAASMTSKLDVLAERLGVEVQQLAAEALAWERGGEEGLEVAMTPWRPTAEQLAPAKAVLGPKARNSANAVSANGVQLRLDQRGLWWRFEPNELLGWVLVGGGLENPAEAADLVAPV